MRYTQSHFEIHLTEILSFACSQFAERGHHAEVDWIKRELNGYGISERCPPYRGVPATVWGMVRMADGGLVERRISIDHLDKGWQRECVREGLPSTAAEIQHSAHCIRRDIPNASLPLLTPCLLAYTQVGGTPSPLIQPSARFQTHQKLGMRHHLTTHE